MRPFRPGRLSAVHSVLLAFLLLLARARAVTAQTDLVGVVVDPDGRPVPRALVRGTASDGNSVGVFADERGQFRLAIVPAANCQVVVTLPGFEPATAACSAFLEEPGRKIVLALAPIRESVLVTATRTEVPSSQLGTSATVFTAEDLERRQTPLLADLVAATPGAMVVRSGGPGALTSLFVRGGESDYNKVLLDGIPLNEPGGIYYLNNLTTEHLERVEVVRGAYSSLFGSDAMASVIQLFTRRADGVARRPRGSVQIDGGTYGTFHGSAGVSGATTRWDYSAGAARFNSDNRVPNSRLESTTLSGNLGFRLNPTAVLRLVGRGELEQVGTPGPTAFGRPDLDAFFDRDDAAVGATFDQTLRPSFRHRVAYSVSTSAQTSTNLRADPPYTAVYGGRTAIFETSDFLNHSHADLRRQHASYQADLRMVHTAAGDQRLTLVADWDGERATQENRLSRTVTSNSRDNFGFAAQHQMLWPRVFATVGARVEHNDSFGTEAVPRATLVFVARSAAGALGDTRLKIGAGTGIKEPTMLESFSVSPFFRGNPDLQPERSRSLEAGIDQRFADDRAKVEVTWFDNRFRDIISLRTNPLTFEGQYFNVGETHARGVELGFETAPHPAVRTRGAYTLLDSSIVATTSPGNVLFAPGRWAFRRPRHSGSIGATIHVARLTTDLNGVFVGRFVDSDFGLFDPPLTENPGHTTWDARLSLRLTPRVSGILTIDNLTDADYSEPFGYQPLGRVVRVGARVTF
jgi:outer membrane cobalamin receptor